MHVVSIVITALALISCVIGVVIGRFRDRTLKLISKSRKSDNVKMRRMLDNMAARDRKAHKVSFWISATLLILMTASLAMRVAPLFMTPA